MKIRYLQTGIETHIENRLGRSLIDGGIAEEIKPAPGVSHVDLLRERQRTELAAGPRPALDPFWEIVNWNGYAGIQMAILKQKYLFLGDPKKIHDRKDHTGRDFSSIFGRPVPDSVLAEYREARKQFACFDKDQRNGSVLTRTFLPVVD